MTTIGQMAKNEKAFFDEAFGQIAQRAGSITGLLDEFFEFLHRRTDFYVQFPMPSDQQQGQQYKMGFPEGKAEEILLNSFRKHKFRDYAAAADAAAPVIAADAPKPVTRAPSSSAAAKPIAQVTEAGKQVPIGNGGVADTYYWTQTLADLTVYVDAPAGVKSKDVQCTISPTQLRLAIGGDIMINGPLDETVRAQESMWTISQGGAGDRPQVVITLDKTRESWWHSVIQGHPQIDTTKVDSTKNIGDYDADTQAAIRKIVHEQREKVSTACLSVHSSMFWLTMTDSCRCRWRRGLGQCQQRKSRARRRT